LTTLAMILPGRPSARDRGYGDPSDRELCVPHRPGELSQQVPALLSYLGGQVGALFLSPRLPQGATVTAAYDHDSLLRSIEDSFGITEHLNLAAKAAPMAAVFARYH
jgi:hypothetical protein